MRIIPFLLSVAATIGLVYTLNIQLSVNGGKTPKLGYLLSPQKGFWQNAEPTNTSFDEAMISDNLQGNSEVYLDDRLVPHIYATNEHDAYFIQGYLHAKFRLWQMEFQTNAAGGRLSEIMGDSSNGTNFHNIDKFFRRLGMVYGAENTLKAMEQDSGLKAACDAYTDGVNAYINSLDESSYPFEFKLLDYKPEPWTNLRTALLAKYMAWDLAGFEQDFEMTNARSIFTKEQFEALYPYQADSLDPVNPRGTVFPKRGADIIPPTLADSAYLIFKEAATAFTDIKPDYDNGSNNWAIDSSKSKSKRPILCNDPHLNLNLPSIWYEMQISAPGLNVYGASLPGAPCIVIGFNDSCAWGVTNAERDVRDYYEITFKDSTRQEYMFDSTWYTTTFRQEIIKIKGKPDDTLQIPMTVWGPVMYDTSFPDKLHTGKAYAVKWMAHEESDELKTFYQLNKAKNFEDYKSAINTYKCPGQNFAFATKNGDIALRQQGKFPAKWRRQGDFVMPGSDSTFAWRGYVPDSLNFTMHNPARGFVSSANQYPYDTSYPYYLGGKYPLYRGILINRLLTNMHDATVDSMQQMQNNNYNLFAEMARPVLLRFMYDNTLSGDEQKYLDTFKAWNLRNDAASEATTIFNLWWDSLKVIVYGDELGQSQLPLVMPQKSTLLESMIKDSVKLFADDINTTEKETIADDVNAAFKKIIPEVKLMDEEDRLAWGKFKNSGVLHLLKIPSLSRLNLFAGGGEDIINAYKQYNGPSWKMIVELTDDINAYAIYPGGQSGNPGSKYYDAFIDDYIAGRYYKLLFTDKATLQKQTTLKGKITFSKSRQTT
ncbi:penicillin acylase family protein [Panacibacter ginsenosidivorans]|uniref:Penicillin acylase family protein n=1 Tax=Panacibacter ginsenosidivorans TaxID=1813871 RepID=A0A5B8V4W6_9BACT|nr:penicillin acylase family protein [Panacibacter ginsenosidivorans]QEC66075.1 penicillin acylase family protein [Panacibacter ginsenosidivorans]